jgi:pimeloyl-ACP methyl ester carboxylesterase
MPLTKAGDTNLEYYVEGSGPPLLLIMGFSGQASSWGEPFLDQLRPHFSTIRFSNRGTGLSDKPESPTSIRQMADDAAALMDAIGIPQAHVCGVSMGGMIAQELVLNYPQKVNGLVLGCTTCGPAHGHTATPEVLAMLSPTPGLAREDQIRKAWPAICAPSFIEAGTAFLEQMMREGLTNATPIETLAKQMMAIQAHDTYERLPQIKAPTLIIHGDADLLVPTPNAAILHERIAGSRLHILPGAAHMFFWEAPRESAGIIVEFLSKVSAPV